MGIIIDDDGVMHKVFTKDEVVAMLTEIQLEIEEMKMKSFTEKEIWNNAIDVCSGLIQQKINALKAEGEG